MQQVRHYDPIEREREKQRGRDQDDRALTEGSVSAEELRLRNSFFSSLDLVDSSVRRRRILA